MRRVSAPAVLVLFAFSLVAALPVGTSSQASSQVSGPVSIALSIVPPVLPADGKSYDALVISLQNSSGLPVVSQQDVKIYLTSVLPSTVNVDPAVDFPAGSSYIVANLMTGNTSGSVPLFASAAGLRTGFVVAQTVIPSGYPDHLAAFAVPGAQLAKTTSRGEILVQVQDDLGVPARTASAVTVSLASSDIRVVQMGAPSVTVQPQQSYAVADYTTNSTGISTITASATGFSTGFTAVQVVRAPPLVLKVTAEPDLIAPGSSGRLIVSLVDRSGDPAEAPADLQVYLTSSVLAVAVIQPSSGSNPVEITIHKNQVFANTTFTSSTVGLTNFTASAHGIVAGFDTVSVRLLGKYPSALRLYLAPNPVPSTGRLFPAIAIGLVNGTGFPSEASTPIPVVVTASDNATGKVIEQITVPFNSGSYAIGDFDSTLLPSTAIITAAAQNLTTAQAPMFTLRPDLPIGPPPTAIAITSLAPSLPADGNNYQGFLVRLLDSSGGPAIAPVDIPVRLSLNPPSLIQLAASDESVTVSANQSYAIVMIRTTSTQGTVNVTAEATGYSGSSTLLTTKALSPAQLALYIAPSPAMFSASGDDALLAVQLQGADGTPSRAKADTSVILTSSNDSLFGEPLQVNIGNHSDYRLVHLNATIPTNAVITALSEGLRPANITVASYRLPVVANLYSSSTTIYLNDTALLSDSIFLMHNPLAGANVTWLASSGFLSAPQSQTGPNGIATVRFTPSKAGVVSFTAVVNSPVVGKLNSTTNVVVFAAPAKVSPSMTSQIVSYLPYIGVGVAAVLIAFIFLWRRRRGTVKETEEDTFSIGGS